MDIIIQTNVSSMSMTQQKLEFKKLLNLWLLLFLLLLLFVLLGIVRLLPHHHLLVHGELFLVVFPVRNFGRRLGFMRTGYFTNREQTEQNHRICRHVYDRPIVEGIVRGNPC